MTCQIQYEITGLANLRPRSPRAQKGRRRSPKLRNHEASPRFQCESKILQIGSNHHTDDTLRWKVITTDDMPKLGLITDPYLDGPQCCVTDVTDKLQVWCARDFARFDGRSSPIYYINYLSVRRRLKRDPVDVDAKLAGKRMRQCCTIESPRAVLIHGARQFDYCGGVSSERCAVANERHELEDHRAVGVDGTPMLPGPPGSGSVV